MDSTVAFKTGLLHIYQVALMSATLITKDLSENKTRILVIVKLNYFINRKALLDLT